MTEQLERRWDDEMEQAWSEFRARLADHVAVQAQDEALVVLLPDDDVDGAVGAAPYCQVMPYGGDRLRVEAVSNAYLDERHRLDEAQEQRLSAAGFARPDDDSLNFWLDVEQREADRVAHVVVEALRWAYGVLHPVYLDAEGLEPLAEADVAQTLAGSASDGLPELDGDGPWTPHDADEVRAMLLRAADDIVDGEPVLDDDGNLTVVAGDCVLAVTIGAVMPRLLLSAVLAVDVVDEQRAVWEANLLNTREFGLSFLVRDGRVVVRRELSVAVFVPDEVCREMERILDHLERWSSEMVARVGGRAPHDDSPALPPADRRHVVAARADGERLAAALETMRELEREDRSGLGASVLVDVFHADRDLLLAAIRETRDEEADANRRARRAEKDGHVRTHRMHRAKARYQRELRSRLRRALRQVVQHHPRESQEQLTLFSEDEATR